ncbi:hypothetical protein GCK32_011397 [Trichostrongylus colubriformis]|uniref:Uncharacterized protein n=1 Tax=Trichostrongylus colubriformis TaxID=6319 RepID=A0AAN8IFV8_TRICO
MKSFILFILLLLNLLIDAKPRPVDSTVWLIRVKRHWGWEWFRPRRLGWARWKSTVYRPRFFRPFVKAWDGSQYDFIPYYANR